jgi:hypothetical protein
MDSLIGLGIIGAVYWFAHAKRGPRDRGRHRGGRRHCLRRCALRNSSSTTSDGDSRCIEPPAQVASAADATLSPNFPPRFVLRWRSPAKCRGSPAGRGCGEKFVESPCLAIGETIAAMRLCRPYLTPGQERRSCCSPLRSRAGSGALARRAAGGLGSLCGPADL